MFLSHTSIEDYINSGRLIIGPEFDKKHIRPVGIRIHLGKSVLVPQPNQFASISGGEDLKYDQIDLIQDEFILNPGDFVLGSTYESIETDGSILPFLDGRSTVARLGITTHITASICDGALGAPNVVVLEIKNVGNFKIRLRYKDPIAMMCFIQLTTPVIQKQQAQYANQLGVAPPNLQFKTGKEL